MRKISDKLQRLMRIAEDQGHYYPATKENFEGCRMLLTLGVFEEHDSYPGAYAITGGGSAMLARLEANEKERAQ